ncbi:hypothetical protein [Desulforegula conservatrix]|uniref:hypothetical protein n=1 Tax=Desulforegula conservatrix TaxID=153026 RepID=UPI000403BF5E|nr:hypothetical protein [Desulforegula conservatrix]
MTDIIKSIRAIMIRTLFFLLCGCATTNIRPIGEKSITRVDLPEKNRFAGITFMLKKVPNQEIVFLLSQSYPEAYIVISAYDADAATVFYDSDTAFMSKPKSCYIAKKHTLAPYLIFHKKKMIAYHRLPEEFIDESVVNLEWEKISGSEEKNIDTEVSSSYGLVYNIFSRLTLIDFTGLIGPIPPLPRMDYWAKDAVKIDSQSFSQRYIPSVNASHFLFSGAFVGLCALPITDVGQGAIINSPTLGSSAYANTISRAFNDLQNLSPCPESAKTIRQKSFDSMYAREGFNVSRYNPKVKTACLISGANELTLYFWESTSHTEDCKDTIYENTFREIFIKGERVETPKVPD